MQVLSAASQLELKDCILSIGNFDGVHLGHQMLLGQMQAEAKTHGKASVVVTFTPPSKSFFTAAPFLSTDTEKLALLEAFAPNAVVMIPFTEAYTKTPKEAFLGDLARLEPHTIIVGENFRFGFKREGSLYDLSQHAGRLEVFNLKHGEGQPISSSRIRELLKVGQVGEANGLLGRVYSVSGSVIRGDQRGRSIGFPTANVSVQANKALPLGVFAVKMQTPLGTFSGMANVGPRPSFPDDPPSLEVNLFEFDADIYGESVSVAFHEFLRVQRKFDGLDDLKAQLAKDKRNAKVALSVLKE